MNAGAPDTVLVHRGVNEEEAFVGSAEADF